MINVSCNAYKISRVANQSTKPMRFQYQQYYITVKEEYKETVAMQVECIPPFHLFIMRSGIRIVDKVPIGERSFMREIGVIVCPTPIQIRISIFRLNNLPCYSCHRNTDYKKVSKDMVYQQFNESIPGHTKPQHVHNSSDFCI